MMTTKEFKTVLQHEVEDDILSYWIKNALDVKYGGVIGRIGGDEKNYADAPKGAILHARLLWTFSSAYRLFHDPQYLELANEMQAYFLSHFKDEKYGGIYWLIDRNGISLDSKKQIYAQGFAIYGLSEHVRITHNPQSLEQAIELFHLIEEKSLDRQMNGYFEAFTREWDDISDMRLSPKDANEKKTMNTHLHMLEAYTNLFRVWPSAKLQHSLSNLIKLFLDKFIKTDTGHLCLFFDENWVQKEPLISYGHEIETSWLLHEAASVLGDQALLKRVMDIVPEIVKAASEGLQNDGSLAYELDPKNGHLDADRHWWVQAEAVVGFWKAYQLFGDESYKENAIHAWNYIQEHLIDPEHGEWFWSIKADGSINRNDDKVGFWKCPYHNSRMCMEIIEK